MLSSLMSYLKLITSRRKWRIKKVKTPHLQYKEGYKYKGNQEYQFTKKKDKKLRTPRTADKHVLATTSCTVHVSRTYIPWVALRLRQAPIIFRPIRKCFSIIDQERVEFPLSTPQHVG